MEFKEHKLEIGIGLFVVILFLGLFKMFGGVFDSPRLEESDISYEMKRPKSDLIGEFSLGDREIDRKRLNRFANKVKKDPNALKAENVKAAKNANKSQQTMPGNWVKVRDQKKKTKDKALRVVDRAKKEATKSDPYGNGNNQARQRYTGGQNTNQDNVVQDKEILSPGQWKALIAAQPTKENIDKLVSAYAAKEIDAGTFYSIVDSLLSTPNDDRQLLGIYALGQFPEAAGFGMVTKKLPEFSENVEAPAMAFLYSFSTASKHGALRGALISEDVAVSYMAAQVILEGATSQGTTRPGRGGAGNVSQTAVYLQFIPIFRDLQENGSDELKSLASQFLGLFPQIAA